MNEATMNQKALGLAADSRQVGGNHYKKGVLQHWDIVVLFNLDYFQGNITKYAMRWRDKGGIQDLEKCVHYGQKYVEIEKARANGTLTRQILDRAIRELERIECEDEHAAMYRAQAKGDDPVGDILSGYPFKLVDEPTRFPHAYDDPIETGEGDSRPINSGPPADSGPG